MADSDGEYIQELSDDEPDLPLTTAAGPTTSNYGTRAKGKDKAKTQAARGKERWERSIEKGFAPVAESADGLITGSVESMLEARKRKR